MKLSPYNVLCKFDFFNVLICIAVSAFFAGCWLSLQKEFLSPMNCTLSLQVKKNV